MALAHVIISNLMFISMLISMVSWLTLDCCQAVFGDNGLQAVCVFESLLGAPTAFAAIGWLLPGTRAIQRIWWIPAFPS